MLLLNWDRGLLAVLDVMVISTLQDFTVAGAHGHALRVAEERKLVAHQSDSQATGISFVVQSLGCWYESAIHNIGCTGRLLGQQSGVTVYCVARIFCRTQRNVYVATHDIWSVALYYGRTYC